MTSVVSFGTTDRINVRKCFNAPRAGSGTPARYSSTFFAATLPFIQVRRERTASGPTAKGEESRPRANGCLHNYTPKLKWSAISLDTPLDFDTTMVPITDWNPANVALNR